MAMNKNLTCFAAIAMTCALTPSTAAPVQPRSEQGQSGEAIFKLRCKSCHDPAVQRAPTRLELAYRPRADIMSALTTGAMAPMAQGLSPGEIEAVAFFLAPGLQLAAAGTDKICATNTPIRAGGGDWRILGVDDNSTRFQPNPGLQPAEVPRLKVKWAFSMPGGGQPIVIGDWLFVTNRGGKFYALDAKSGCVHWAIEAASSRTAPSVFRSSISPSGWATLIGVASNRTVRAFDAQTGKELWHTDSLDSYSASVITGTPAVSGSQVFVPLSSGEEVVAMQANYACCTFRGSIVALDFKTGHKQWQTYMINEPLHPTHQNAGGVMMQGPAGAPVWAAPTADAKRQLLYVVTGDSYTDTATNGTDAIVALEMKTGTVRWRHQVTKDDNYIQGCSANAPRVSNCPTPVGPDFDFGATPLLFGKSGRSQVLIAAQKSGVVWGLDPDTGQVRWNTKVGMGSPLGGIEWGIGADRKYIFVPNSDIGQLFNEVALAAGKSIVAEWEMPGKPGLSAIDGGTGKLIWNVPAPIAPCHYSGDRSKDYTQGACVRAQSAAPAVMPGIVFSGTLDGWFRAYDTSTGRIVWQFNTTAQTYATVNGNAAQPGGGIDGMGPTIAGGMVYTMSGFNGASQTGSNGINVLLAFSVDGR
jgi:polyvinyl alcohol dehydrogenase (cytochrome)